MSRPRDDRTVRVLEQLVDGGRDRAELAMTHFVGRRVLVVASARVMAMPNGKNAVRVAVNMLERFVGAVAVMEAWDDTLVSRFDAVLSVGQYCQSENERAVSVTFDAWRCAIARGCKGTALPDARSSEIAFGALAAVCFGVAEVFKTILAGFVELEELLLFRKRFTHAWAYSAWRQDRVDMPNEWDEAEPQTIASVHVDDVLQVGAGAVGNGAAYAFSATLPVQGSLTVLDVKLVDETNLNRCLCFRAEHVTLRKVDVLHAELSRPGLRVLGLHERYGEALGAVARVLLSTVDNNEVRHQMQETVPRYIIEGSTGGTGGTQVCVSVHTAVDGKSCLVCRHPERERGLPKPRELTSNEIAEITAKAREERRDECGAIADLRATFSVQDGPCEASAPFVSVLAGVLAAAEVVKVQLSAQAFPDVPVLSNMMELDLVRDYSRHVHLSFLYPPLKDCGLCQDRRQLVNSIYIRKYMRDLSASRRKGATAPTATPPPDPPS